MENKVRVATSQYRHDKWAKIIMERNASNLSIKSWCQQNNVSEAAYYYWQKKIRLSIVESMERNGKEEISFVPMLSDQSYSGANNTTNNNERHASQSEIVIKWGDIAIEVGNHASRELLSSVLGILKNVQ